VASDVPVGYKVLLSCSSAGCVRSSRVSLRARRLFRDCLVSRCWPASADRLLASAGGRLSASRFSHVM